MIHIKYKLEQSTKGDLGLFTLEDLEPSQLVWSYEPTLDIDIPAEEFDRMDEAGQQEIRKVGFLLEPEDVWHVSYDLSQIIRHSTEPNLVQDKKHQETYLTAKRAIKTGEELTKDFSD